MANNIWVGTAPAIAQVNTITLAGTIATSQLYSVTINGKSVGYTALNTDTNTTAATALQAALAASTIPEFQEITWTNPSNGVILGTASTAGIPFTQTSSASGTGTLVTQAGIATPVISSFSTATSGGSLNDTTTYYYRLSALNAAGETLAHAEQSETTGNSGSNVNTITLNWSAPAGTGITGYKIYGRTTGAEQLIATVGATATSYVDTGSISPSGALPLANTTVNSGPNDVSCLLNWSLGAIPVATNNVYLTNSSQGLLYNLATLNGVTLTTLNIDSTFTGNIGLPAFNSNGYYEYRPLYFQVSATTLNITGGSGAGTGFCQIDFGSVQTAANIAAVGSASQQGRPAIVLKGTHASNVMNATQGSIGSAIDPGDVSTWATINIGYQTSQATDVTLLLGSGCTLTTINQEGGVLTYQSAVTTHLMYAGTATVLGTGAVTTLNCQSGSVSYQSSGTITTLTGGESGSVDFSHDPRSRTVTNCTAYGGSVINDPNHTVTFTNPISVPQGLLPGSSGGATVNWGSNFNVQRS